MSRISGSAQPPIAGDLHLFGVGDLADLGILFGAGIGDADPILPCLGAGPIAVLRSPPIQTQSAMATIFAPGGGVTRSGKTKPGIYTISIKSRQGCCPCWNAGSRERFRKN
jgi:hypothetical protein